MANSGNGLEGMSGPDLQNPMGTDVQARQFRAARASNILEHRSLLDIYSEPSVPRLTSIVCTIGERFVRFSKGFLAPCIFFSLHVILSFVLMRVLSLNSSFFVCLMSKMHASVGKTICLARLVVFWLWQQNRVPGHYASSTCLLSGIYIASRTGSIAAHWWSQICEVQP